MLKELRIKAKLTQAELARKLNVTQQTVSQWESGNAKPTIDTIVKIAKVLKTEFTIVAECFVG